MSITFQELETYKNFDELARDVLDLAKEILPEQLFYLSAVSDQQQLFLKLSSEDSNILVTEGMVFNLENTLCNLIDFEKNLPLVYEDIREEPGLGELRNKLEGANVRSYLGLPISLMNGERFGTLCAINDEKSHFDNRSIQLLQRIVRLFSYYLDLEYFAYRDTLTELYNRRYLDNYFEEHSHEGGSIFFLDLDGFKKVNDVHGHDAGDAVLEEVAWKLGQIANEHRDAFAMRLGGDEFLLHLSDLSGREEMSRTAERILASLNTWDAGYQLSASIGIVAYPSNDNPDLKRLLKNADEALYQAKTSGKNTYQFF